MKKLTALLSLIVLTLFFVLPFLQGTAHAAGASITLRDGDSLYLPDFATSEIDTITVASYSEVTIKGDPGTSDAVRGIQIKCYPGCTVILENVYINNNGSEFEYETFENLSFSGSGNTLILAGESIILGGSGAAAIEVNSGCYLVIKGDGELICHAGTSCAAIGSSYSVNCGQVTIEGNVYIYAFSFYCAAAIGGGYGGNGGTVNINDNATVFARGRTAGIGGGLNARGGKINISGGYVYARGLDGPGLGGNDDSPSVSDEVIKITGGIVFASTKSGESADIGNPGNNKLLEISGDAAVLLEHDITYPDPTTEHRHLNLTDEKNGKIYGYEISSFITDNDRIKQAAAYLPGNVYEIKYNSNGGSPDTFYGAQFPGEATILEDGSIFTQAYYHIEEWNTSRDGSGKTYSLGQSNIFASDANVYAQWKPNPVDSIEFNVEKCSLHPGESFKPITTILPSNAANTSLIQWSSSNPLAGIFSADGTFTASTPGTATITATIGGKSAQYEVEITIDPTEIVIETDMYLNDKIRLVPTFIPVNTTNKEITWSSSDESILEVDENGEVTAKDLGQAWITAAYKYDETIECRFDITVIEKPIESVFFLHPPSK